ncbi:MAG TPA: crossover junction endodeoxyribonuclease RuvC [Actinomycetota bacterium]|nr:crossover junction endodeoxyribonuclease RuvC [Actinomycetota bacterium]
MRVLGIDPGLATMGYGIVERIDGRFTPLGLGVIRTDPRDAAAARLAQIRRDILEIITSYEPDVVAVERLFFNSNVKTAMSVGQASGVALATAAEKGLEVHDYTPPEVKQSVVGVGNASKRQVQIMVASVLRLAQVPRFPDAADACALAICHLNRSGLRHAIGALYR